MAAAILSGFDARQWSGSTVLTWSGHNVTLPTYSRGTGLFEEAPVFLNGRASGTEAIIGDTAAAWVASGAGGTLTMDIDPTTGRVRLTSSAVDFAVEAGAGANLAWWGFDAAGHGLVGGGAPFVRVAPAPFLREPAFSPSLYINPTGAPAAFSVGGARWWQDPITAMRERGVMTDADSALITHTQTLEALIIAATGAASIRAGLTAAGHVIFAWRTGITKPGPPTWVSTTFRDRLGFSGSETTASSGLVDYIVADYPCPGVMVIEDGFDEYDLTAETVGSAVRMMGGGYGAASYGTRAGANVRFDLRGPATGSNLHTHWLERCVRYLPPAGHCTLYPVWGEMRRRLPDGAYGKTTSRPAESLLYTNQPTWAPGYNGRRRGFVAPGSTQNHVTAWQSESRTWWTVALSVTMAEE